MVVELIREDLKRVTKTLPSFAIEHPEVYELFGIPEEIKKAYRLHTEPEPVKTRRTYTPPGYKE